MADVDICDNKQMKKRLSHLVDIENEQKIYDKIKQRRYQMLVHSYLYYEMDESIIDDYTWSKWARELKQLQDKYPKISKKVIYYKLFKDWTGDSGSHLTYDDKIKKTAKKLLEKRA